ncbi:Acyl-CoA synthetase (AMP-forming)/AMP-acid ligase II [Amycolatopsis arida]|uniref:Acyl-CoA synthetase (AMP-forming)/AMP-acid ligase II n=1 Tax=Amycolatopsis arida TaxID=587909 RepID=A0A1I5V7E6_9PSEU|nr:class I adenylate-forming enzyme family protein [Amycolatopsis arida]TDX91178.1 acyl-CoA synthetase (AMP-forming)/AMP-acid ligase II [Amycolatopsis arida]SFQ03454.1 Acyl-CoA synthetase (AMP-forming)/AMP-acid ligase II [Amycolatopsis arida]
MIFDKLQALPADAEPWIVDHEPIIVAARDERIHPGDVADAAARTATVLREAGVVGGTRCVVWLESPTDIIVAYAAITALDAVPVLISPTLTVETLEAMIDGVAGITAVVSTGDRLEAARAHLPHLAAVDWREVTAALPGARRFSREPEVASHAAYVVVHTSGTTGVPKLVECSSRSIRFNASVQAVIHWAARLRGYLALAISPVHGRTVVGILAALMRRAPLLLLQDDSAGNVERMLLRHRPTYLETHPNTFRAWQHLAQGGAFRSVRVFGAGFDVIHPDTVRALLAGSGHRLAVCMEVYGQNESGPIAIRCHLKGMPRIPSRWQRRRERLMGGHRVGPRFAFCRVRILRDDGTPQPPGTPGRIVVRTPGTFSGYLNRPDLASRNHPKGRWWDTGDWGMCSRLGLLTLIDRQVDKVSSAPSAIAVENVLLDQFPELLELVVVDVDGTVWPVLSLRPGCEFRARDWASAAPRVAAMADPLVIPDGEFPRTVTGKIKREQLKDLVRRRAAVAR